jgi:uncharacterized membrane protein YciS (DUF1049 family)
MERAMNQTEIGGVDAILHQLKTHDSRIGGLEAKFDVFNSKLGEISTSLNLLAAKPSFDVTKAIQLCVQGGLLFSMVVSGIIWLAVQLNASELTALRAQDAQVNYRIEDLTSRITRFENRAP